MRLRSQGVREASAVLRDIAGHYTLVSTLSVHPDDMPAGSTERSDTLAWDQQRGLPVLRTGLTAELERELLATWHSRR